MNTVMQGTQYQGFQASMDSSWLQYHPFFSNQICGAGTPGTPYDFIRSPNTSSGSDESMNNSKIDKRSPKYLEKREKNNQAAKKSRLHRKEREEKHMKENEELKKKLAEMTEQNAVLLRELDNLRKALSDMTVARDYHMRVNDNKFAMIPPHSQPLRDITNNQNNQMSYERL